MDQDDGDLLSLLATDLDRHFRQLVMLYQQRLYSFALPLEGCVIHFGSCANDKSRYLGEKVLEQYLLAHDEAYLGIGRASRCKTHVWA